MKNQQKWKKKIDYQRNALEKTYFYKNSSNRFTQIG
jgi:hypothetical protein